MTGKLPSISSMLNNGDSNKSVSTTPLPGMSNNNSYTNLTSMPKPLLTNITNNQMQQENYTPLNNLSNTHYMVQKPNDNKQHLTIPVMSNQYSMPPSPYMHSMKYNGHMRNNQIQITPLSANTIVYKQYPSANVPNFPLNGKVSFSDAPMGFSNLNTPINSTQYVSQNFHNSYPVRNRTPLDMSAPRQNFQSLPLIYHNNMMKSSNPSPIMVQPINCNINNEGDNKMLQGHQSYTPMNPQMIFNPRYNEINENALRQNMGMNGYKFYPNTEAAQGEVSPKGSFTEMNSIKEDGKKVKKTYKTQKKNNKAIKDNSIVEVDCLNVETPIKKVPRPRNAFILFRQHYHKIIFKEQSEILLKNKETPPNDEVSVDSFKLNSTVSKAIGLKWKNLSEDERSHWVGLAEKEKIEHSLKYPDYKYVPKRRKTISTLASIQAKTK